MADLSFEPLTYDDLAPEERPSLVQALVPLVGMLTFLGVGKLVFGLDPQLPLLWGIALTGAVGRYWLGIPWRRLYEGIVDGLVMGMQAILIIFVIYALIATWMGAGTIPALIYYGLDLLSPRVFLPAAALFAAVVAFAVGSSWTTAGTLGVAFIGIGVGLGVPEPMTAGAVLSGAYTGDKISPLSDTTNLAAAVTNTDLMSHVRTMRVGTSIALGISVLGYAALGLGFDGAVPPGRIEAIQGAIAGSFTVHPLVFVPLLLTFGLALRGYPALPTLGMGAIVGALVQILVQGGPFVGTWTLASLAQTVTAESFTAAWEVAQSGTAPETGVEQVNSLLATDGLVGSAWTITIIVAALALGGLLERTGILAVVAHAIGRAVSSVAGLTAGTVAAAFSMNVLSADQYMSIVVPGISLRNIYDEFDLETRNLSRAVEAGGTTTSALVPWNSGGVYMATVLGVPTLAYAPYYFFGFLSPLVVVVMGLTGWRIARRGEETEAGIAAAARSLAEDD
ncbi:Na+/H+ antiporter NhaC family protein [Halomarina ordinaria]|uniref:Na+/H+ antiporter NhaC family protein n=1 Tax=Halomarina ordinaria TaxID=3033939 RepID=A0ABD5UB29_9EURY|nr:Na+/H+ antiporter NhaC family protein [Halomarina sp. PSRA2]